MKNLARDIKNFSNSYKSGLSCKKIHCAIKT